MNSNPETVSTDYDTSSRLYFEPLTGESLSETGEVGREREREREREVGRGRERRKAKKKKGKLTVSSSPPDHSVFTTTLQNTSTKTVEDVLNVVEKCRPDGIIVQFGGQTPLKLATPLAEYLKANPIPAASGDGNVKIWGTQPESIDAAEDRDLWYELLQKLQIKQPPGTMVSSEEAALKAADALGYPVMVRPSFVLGGRAMEIVYSDKDLSRYIRNAVEVDPDKPVLVDKVRRMGVFFLPFFLLVFFGVGAEIIGRKREHSPLFLRFSSLPLPHPKKNSTSTAPTRSTSTRSATRTVTSRSAASCSTSSR